MLLYLLLLVLVIFQKMISPAIGITILGFFGMILFTKDLKFYWNWPLYTFFILFIIYAISLLWTDHLEIGGKLLEYKMVFFIFPIIFSFKSVKINFWLIIEGFLVGAVLLALGLLLGIAYGHDDIALASDTLFHLHPTYSSAYLTNAAFILAYGKYKGQISWHSWLVAAVLILWVFVIFLLISFAAILFIILAIGAIGIYLIYKRRGAKTAVGLTIGFGLVFFIILSRSQVLSYDYATTKQTIVEVLEEPEYFIIRNNDAVSGTKQRVLMWIFASQVIWENPMGVGLGDIDFALEKKIKEYGVKPLLEKQLNPHNQFLQIGVDTGFLGMIFLIGMIVYLMRYALKTKNYILLFILLNLTFNCLFESMLQRQSGIIFYTLMICFTISANPTKQEVI